MFAPIERRNAAGDAIESLKIAEYETSAVRLVAQDGGGIGSIELDDAALDEAITQLCIIRTSRKVARDVAAAGQDRQAHRFDMAASLGYGAHDAAPARRSADADRLIDRVR